MKTALVRTTATVGAIATTLCVATALGGRSDHSSSSSMSGGHGGSVDVTVTIENLAPDGGSSLTPVWVAFHDGTFDTYDRGAAVSPELERLAEDGNTGPISDLFDAFGAGDTQATIASSEGIPPLEPGEMATMTFTLDGDDPANRYFSYASMVLPSNDAFVANGDPRAHRIFKNNGRFRGTEFLIFGTATNDAGSELNDENPMNTAFFGQMTPDTGLDEAVPVTEHVGFKFPGAGGILDDASFVNADFLASGYIIARVTVTADGGGSGSGSSGSHSGSSSSSSSH